EPASGFAHDPRILKALRRRKMGPAFIHYNYAYSNDFDRREVKLIPDVSQALAWLEKHPQALQGIQRGGGIVYRQGNGLMGNNIADAADYAGGV
ncbi:hypothetical protein FK513_31865, partial [Klebsiella pneumoniae]|nr:hypothetical protein [Klebsiella pneumoniae]